jgi:Ca2+-binding EF-hand superfamily protein
MFDQAQIQEFKEAFNMIDQNRDGFVDKEDLHDMLASLGEFCRGSLIVCAHETL